MCVPVVGGDGDTLTVLEQGNRQVRIRLAEIDAPKVAMVKIYYSFVLTNE